jgi:hypothetical protein
MMSSAAFGGVEDRTVTYTLFTDPANPVDTTFTIELDLVVNTVYHNRGDDGGSVLWDIDAIRIEDVAKNESWRKALQSTTWTTTHADLGAIIEDEFLVSPQLIGIAASEQTGVDDLDFDVEAVTYTGQQYFAPTAGLDYEFTKASVTIGAGDDEPADPDEHEDPN